MFRAIFFPSSKV